MTVLRRAPRLADSQSWRHSGESRNPSSDQWVVGKMDPGFGRDDDDRMITRIVHRSDEW
jgi:hypothetical protein